MGPGPEGGVRAGGRVLEVLSKPLNTQVLRAHGEGWQRLSGIQERTGWSAEATLRGAVKALCEVGALERQRIKGRRRGGVATALTSAGEEMLVVARVLEKWLAACPKGPIPIDGKYGSTAVSALASGWNSALVRALASRPHTLTELSSLIPDLSYPALERRLTWMRTTGQISSLERQSAGTPYVPTEWLRRAIAPLAAAGRWEKRYLDDAPPITDVEVETGFLLSMPLVHVSPDADGACTLASQTDPKEPEDDSPPLAGVAIRVEHGRIASYDIRIDDGEPSTWALAPTGDWLDALIDGHFESLRVGGADPQLAIDLVSGLHYSLSIDR